MKKEAGGSRLSRTNWECFLPTIFGINSPITKENMINKERTRKNSRVDESKITISMIESMLNRFIFSSSTDVQNMNIKRVKWRAEIDEISRPS